jgi:UDP-N-acetylglucosamine 2-epimerase (non-hydrolysing)/UDP-GlcNAc3NAcA epimerase
VRILTVVGNRPQFIKAAAVSRLLREQHEEVLVHTGQHYDENLSRVFFAELGLAEPDRRLGIGGGSNTSQTARMLSALEPLLAEVTPDAVLVYGDTNSTLAGGLAATQAQIPVVHVEAGMRSYDRTMPEELNRVLTDHLSALLLCASDMAAENLRAESVVGRVEVVGDVMVDVALRRQPSASADERTPAAFGVRRGEYLLLTAHRAGNVDDPARLRALVDLVAAPPHTHAPAGSRARRRAGESRGPAADGAARLCGVRRAAVWGARGAHRLGGRPEGGVPCRGALHHVAREHGVGRDGERWLEHARGPECQGGVGGAYVEAAG